MESDGKPVQIYCETAGETTETALSLNVRLETGKSNYKIPKGFKLKIYDVEIEGEGETLFRIRCGTDSTTALNNPVWKSYKLASKGYLKPNYKMPIIIDAFDNDLYMFITVVQPTAVRASMSIHGEISQLIE